MQLSLLNFILLLAAAQGLLLAVLIFHKHRRLFANRILGTLMLGYSITISHNVAVEMGYYQQIPSIMMIMLGIILAIIPMQYLYVKYLTTHQEKFDNKDWLHFLIVLFYELSILPTLFSPETDMQNLQTNASAMSLQFIIFNWIVAFQGFIYMALCLRLIKKFNRRIKVIFSSIEKIKLDWLQSITRMALLVWCVFVAENLLLLFGINLTNFDLSSCLLAIVVYATGYLGLIKSEIYSEPAVQKSMEQIPTISLVDHPFQEVVERPGKYEKSGLDPEAAQAIRDKLVRIMQEKKPYTDNNLTLGQLAETLGTTAHNLSEVINLHLHQNFYDFINDYRIRQVKADLVDPAKSHLKILSIAFDAGFNSKASFNTLFKKYTRQTPSGYRIQALECNSRAA
jgi:AraC-like DNA-binding protein